MIIYYSGSTSGESLPERALANDDPAIMLTFWEIFEGKTDTKGRFNRHKERIHAKSKSRAVSASPGECTTRAKRKRDH
jgi:hypothetical protein